VLSLYWRFYHGGDCGCDETKLASSRRCKGEVALEVVEVGYILLEIPLRMESVLSVLLSNEDS
jgi:hypothetical protein